MRHIQFALMLVFILLITACARSASDPVSDNPTVPSSDITTQSVLFTPDVSTTGHHVAGMWDTIMDIENETIEVVPRRILDFHFNIRKFMEEGPCTTCFTIVGFEMLPDNEFTVDIQLEHPFPGNENLTAFDLRLIMMHNGSYVFPSSGLILSDRELGDCQFLNPDGYTTLWNPVDFPEGSAGALLTYTRGKVTTILDHPATLNGYRAYFPEDTRRMFEAGDKSDIQSFHIAWPQGSPLRIGYAVDISWDLPTVSPPVNPLNDFPIEANCMEAWRIIASIGSGLMPGCGYAPYQVDVYDWQGYETVEMVTFEAPDLFTGIITDSVGWQLEDFTRFTGNLPNELEVGEGEYRVLVGVVDTNTDPLIGNVNAYQITTAVVEFVDLDYDSSWRKQGRTLDNHNHNTNETEITATLEEVWRHEFSSGLGAVFECTPTHGGFGVYVTVNIPYKQEIWCMNSDTGIPQWHRYIKYQPDLAIYSSSPLIGNCEVYVGGSSVLCFDSEDGDFIWDWESSDTQFIHGSPVLADDILVVWGANNTITAFDPFLGISIWDYTISAVPGNPFTPVIENGVVYAGDVLGNAFALDLQTGAELWVTTFPNTGPASKANLYAQPVMADGLIWFASYNCNLYGLDPSDGSIVHTVPLGDQIARAGPAFDGNHLYQPTTFYGYEPGNISGPFKVMAINTDGTVAWEHPGIDEFEAFFSTPAVANGIVYVLSDYGVIYMLDPDDGSVEGTYTLDNPSRAGVSIQNGRLYTMDEGGVLYCLGPE